jgi:hypothetical protein
MESQTAIEIVKRHIREQWPCTCDRAHDYECMVCELLDDSSVWGSVAVDLDVELDGDEAMLCYWMQQAEDRGWGSKD